MLEQSLLIRPADLLDKTAFLFGRFATSSTHLFHENMVFTSLDFLNNLIPYTLPTYPVLLIPLTSEENTEHTPHSRPF